MPPLDPEQDIWFKQNLLPYGDQLAAWLRRKYPNVRDVEDIVQDCFLKTIVANGKRPINSPKSYLFTAARNQAINHSKRMETRGENVLARIEEFDVLDSETDVVEDVAHKQELEILEEAIKSLPARCREIFELRKVHGLSQQEIAERLGLSVFTVYHQLSIAFDKCACFVERYEREGRQ